MKLTRSDAYVRRMLRLQLMFLRTYEERLNDDSRCGMEQGNDSSILYLEDCRRDDFDGLYD